MKMAYRINYTISAEDGDIEYSNYFYARDLEEIKAGIIEMMIEYGADKHMFIEDCAIYGVGDTYDIVVTVENVQMFDEKCLSEVLNIND